jgi:excinuclease ABC subunit C
VPASNGDEPAESGRTRREALAAQRRELPDAPGVYILADAQGRVVYVGKSLSIRKRVASHFSARSTLGRLADTITSIDFLVTETEAEALLAEQQFIKRHRPLLNVKLRDDKSYPYIGISLDEEFPRVYFTRERHRASRAYFGPYATARRVRETLELLGKLFQYRTCEGPEPGRRSGVPCLDYYIKRCGAPCVGYVDRDEYMRSIDSIRRFLGGRYREVERDLEQKMDEAAADRQYERAALFRDRLAAVRSLMERQRVAGEAVGTADLIGVAVAGEDANAQVFQVRDGVLAERQGFYLENKGGRQLDEVAEQFLAQYYAASPVVPPLVVVGPELADRTGLLADALGERRGATVEVRAAARGDKRRLRELAERNAALALAQEGLRRERRRAERTAALAELAEALGLDEIPIRVEGYDISNIGPEHTTASMVVFEGGVPRKDHYRRFNIRGRAGAVGPDDFASIEEVLRRRMARFGVQSDLSPHDAERDESFAALPALVVIDGGPGQLSAGLKALEPVVARGVRVVSLAKRLEEVYVPESSRPLPIAPDSEAGRLLQRIRDEAHRFALEGHRRRRSKAMTTSVLDELPGVGPARKRALLGHFGSPELVMSATREELEAVPGIPGKLAREIHSRFNKAG